MTKLRKALVSMAASGEAPAASPEAAGRPGPCPSLRREGPVALAGPGGRAVAALHLQRPGARRRAPPPVAQGTVKPSLLAALGRSDDVLQVFGAVTRRPAGRIYNVMSKTETVR